MSFGLCLIKGMRYYRSQNNLHLQYSISSRHRLDYYARRSECDEYIQIFKYSNILVTNIYSDIRSYQLFFYEYIWTFVRVKFVCTNIFGHSLVIVLECKTKTNIRIYSNIHSIFNMNTYSDIRSCQKINMNIFGYSFV